MYISSYVEQLAQDASSICGLDKNVILAQWDAEEGIANANWPGNNPAGITPGNAQVDALGTGATTSGGFVVFPTPAAGARGYALLYKTDSNYAGVRAAIPNGPIAQIKAIEASPWDAGHYQENGYNHLIATYNALTGGNAQIQQDSSSNYTAPSSSSANNQINSKVNFPQTDYSVIAQSQHYGNILYGRRYRVVVTTKNGTGLDVSDLQCSFTIKKVIMQKPPFSTVTIYGLNPETELAILAEGQHIFIEAGYEGTQYGTIFQGDILEPIRSKPDNVTEQLTLYCLDSNLQLNNAFANFSINRGQSARSLLQNLASKSTVPTQFGQISSYLSDVKLPRGKSVFGMTRDYINQIADGNNLTAYADNGEINLIHPADLPKGEIFDLGPSSGLIGTPTQQSLGVDFKSLLNPSLTINSFVHIENSLITAQTFQIGASSAQEAPKNLDPNGIYRIIGVTITGDTRGQEWYSQCQSVAQAGSIPGVISTITGHPWGG